MANQLLAMGQWAAIQNQTILNGEVIEQLQKCYLDVWDKIQDDGKVCPSFMAVRDNMNPIQTLLPIFKTQQNKKKSYP